MFDESVAALRSALARYLLKGERPDPEARVKGLFAYPELRVDYRYDAEARFPPRAYGRLNQPGRYAISIARPRLFRHYLAEQLGYLIRDYRVEVSVGRSASEIPFPYVLDGTDDLRLDDVHAAELGRWFPATELARIGDEIADGAWNYSLRPERPLALFDGPRVDFSLARLRHYTGTPAEHTQRYLLFTNYIRYVDEFVRFAVDELQREDSPYEAFSAAGDVYVTRETPDAVAKVIEGGWRRQQMPAYHLIEKDGGGITLVNIGVGPSNAKTICDHLAVLRPEAWLMIGHCGGLRPSQTIGDYVLAHAYLRDDHVLDDVLPVEVPLPAIAEIQQALFSAAAAVTGEGPQELKSRLRTGTVVTTDDRNWELR
ncbi:MAG: AMP nucleosidase, partial [Pseudomonadota bacterium]|nr:AMP nucleosidase [Pseudomonadota bacterium]